MFGMSIVLFAFVLGFALSRASTCTVAATTRLVTKGKSDWLIGIIVAVSWSALTLLLLNLIAPDRTAAPDSFAVNVTLVAASAVMGLGAWLNGGCFIGSVGKISSGNLSFLFTFFGLAFARLISRWPPLVQAIDLRPIPRISTESGTVYWIIIAAFALLVAWSLWRMYRRRQQAMFALSAMGIAAGLLFASRPDWSYEALIGRLVNGQGVSDDYLVETTVTALFAGAIISAALNRKFNLTYSDAGTTFLCFVGGTLMGLSAIYVPGGNDTLLLWAIPGLAFHGFVAYLTMVAVVALLVAISPQRKS